MDRLAGGLPPALCLALSRLTHIFQGLGQAAALLGRVTFLGRKGLLVALARKVILQRRKMQPLPEQGMKVEGKISG